MGVNREYVYGWAGNVLNNSEGKLYLQYMRRKSLTGCLNHNIYPVYADITGYFGGVLSFIKSFNNTVIYFVPYGSATATQWHKIETNTTILGSLPANTSVVYAHGVTCVFNAYIGGCLDDNYNTVFVPYDQATADYWHYIDTNGIVHSYTNAYVDNHVGGAYMGGAKSTTMKRVYFAPYKQSLQEYWSYVDGSHNVHLYNAPDDSVGNAYCGAVCSDDGRIYFIPYGQATAPTWHYIDTNGTVISYTHGSTLVAGAYFGGVLCTGPYGGLFDSFNNHRKIYFVPYKQATATVWHFLDLDNDTVVAYTHGATCVDYAYCGGVLAPNGRIYLIPFNQATATVWHYIDSTAQTTASVVAYTHGLSGMTTNAFAGGVLNPDGKIYLIPNNSNQSYYIDTQSSELIGLTVSYSPFYNKF